MKYDRDRTLGDFIFASRWLLYPINVGLTVAVTAYIGRFLYEDFNFIHRGIHFNMEEMMVLLLGFVDASMVANLIIMIAMGNHQIFIKRFEMRNQEERPQWLDHVDSGILKVKVALSILGITLVQILKDFVNIEHTEWSTVVHRMYIHLVCLVSALTMAIIWRTTHPQEENHKHEEEHSRAATTGGHS